MEPGVVGLVSVLGRLIAAAFRSGIRLRRVSGRGDARRTEAHPAVLLFSHRSYIDGGIGIMQANRLPPVHMFGGINLSFGLMGPHAALGDDLHPAHIGNDPLYACLRRLWATWSRSGST